MGAPHPKRSHPRHNTILPELPCSGEVIEREEFSMGQVRVAICSACGREFQYGPDSDWLKLITPGMRIPSYAVKLALWRS
jgi:hypothetical protein